jgi:hypothetical protein
MPNLQSAKNMLEMELKEAPYVKDFLWGNAATRRKIEDYIIESVKAELDVADCIEWFKALLQDNQITDEYEMPLHINTYSKDIRCLYDIVSHYIRTL